MPRLLIEIGMEPKGFLAFARSFLKEFGPVIGSPDLLRDIVNRRQIRYVKGMTAARRVFIQKAA